NGGRRGRSRRPSVGAVVSPVATERCRGGAVSWRSGVVAERCRGGRRPWGRRPWADAVVAGRRYFERLRRAAVGEKGGCVGRTRRRPPPRPTQAGARLSSNKRSFAANFCFFRWVMRRCSSGVKKARRSKFDTSVASS